MKKKVNLFLILKKKFHIDLRTQVNISPDLK